MSTRNLSSALLEYNSNFNNQFSAMGLTTKGVVEEVWQASVATYPAPIPSMKIQTSSNTLLTLPQLAEYPT